MKPSGKTRLLQVAFGAVALIGWTGLLYGFSGQDQQERRISRLEAKVQALQERVGELGELEKIFRGAVIANRCVSNLKQIESAKEQWAMVERKGASDAPKAQQLVGSSAEGFLDAYPKCPAGGTYTIGNMMTRPKCSIAGHALN